MIGDRKALSLAAALVWVLIVGALYVRAQRMPGQSSGPPPADAPPWLAVVGAVRSPARFELWRKVRLTELLDCAGGPSPDSAGKVYVFSYGPGDGENTIVTVDLKVIKAGRAEDPILGPSVIGVQLASKKKGGGHCITAKCAQARLAEVFKLPLRRIK